MLPSHIAVHRFGQFEDVRVVRFVTKKTVEESILDLQESKKMLIQGALGGDISKMNQLRIKDLRVLFRWNAPIEPSDDPQEVMRALNTPVVHPADLAEAMARVKSTSPQDPKSNTTNNNNNNDNPKPTFNSNNNNHPKPSTTNNNNSLPILPTTPLKSEPKVPINGEQIIGTATNALTQQHKNAILKFLAGDRNNPYFHLGNVVPYLLNEEYVQSTADKKGYIIQIIMELNYLTGEWKKVFAKQSCSNHESSNERNRCYDVSHDFVR